MKKYPLVSIIILNLDGKKIIPFCLNSLRKINYPREKTEIIVVDNGSRDGSVSFIRKNYPEVKIIRNSKNLGFCKPNNVAAKKAKGEYLVFLNNDMKVEKDWLVNLVDKIVDKKNVATVSSKILSWDGKKINHGGADSDIFFNARLEGYMEKDSDKFNKDKEILFPSGGSMIISRELFLSVGGFDNDFFAYYEDVDLGIRLKIMGYENHFASKSLVYHMHSATSKKLPVEKVRRIQIRNILWILIKNYSDENLNKILAPALLLSLNRTFEFAGNFQDKKYNAFRIESKKTKKVPLHLLRKFELLLISDMIGYTDILAKWQKFLKKREFVQKRRKVNDEEIFKLMKSKYTPIVENPQYKEVYESFLEFFKLRKNGK